MAQAYGSEFAQLYDRQATALVEEAAPQIQLSRIGMTFGPLRWVAVLPPSRAIDMEVRPALAQGRPPGRHPHPGCSAALPFHAQTHP